jgi:hypothetical protein
MGIVKLEVEIDEQLLPALCLAAYEAPTDEDRALTAARGVENILRLYANMPEIVTEKHSAALAVLRDKAVERAVQCAKPGEDTYNLMRNAEALLDAVLIGGR